MDGDASTAPSPARVALARRAGLRPRSPWLAPGLVCLGLALVIPRGLGGEPREVLRAAWSGRELDGLVDMALGAWSIGLVVVVACALASASFGLGWVRRERRLGRVGALARAWGPLAVALLAMASAAWGLRGAPAGAARAVDASAAGLAAMWIEWLRRGLLAVGAASLVAAALDLWLTRRAIWRALYRTRAEVREQARG